MLALPKGAADTDMPSSCTPSIGVQTWPGRKGARCARTPIGPMPGPPPPCGMQKVLCRFRCETSAPNLPGRAMPTSAFMLAPSR